MRAFADVKSFNADTLGEVARVLLQPAGAQLVVAQLPVPAWSRTRPDDHDRYQPRFPSTSAGGPAGAERTSCKGGVFMENFVTSYGGQSPWVRDSDPLYPCNTVAERDKYTCYQQATTRIIRVVGLDWEKIAQACAEAESN